VTNPHLHTTEVDFGWLHHIRNYYQCAINAVKAVVLSSVHLCQY